MNPWALFSLVSLFMNLFVWVYVFAQHKRDPINITFLLVAGDAIGWTALDLVLYLPFSAGHEMTLLHLISIFWIPSGSWFLLFAYALVGRKWDKILLLSFMFSVAGIGIHLFTDQILLGYRHLSYGIIQIHHPIYFSALALTTGVSVAYAIWLILKKRRSTAEPLEKRSLTRLIFGTVLAMGAVATINAVIPAVVIGSTIPKFGPSAFALFILLVFLAVSRYRFLSISVEKVAEELFEDVRDGILLTDRSGQVRRCNTAARELLAGPLVGKDIDDVFVGYDVSEDFADMDIERKTDKGLRHISVSASTTVKCGKSLGRIFILRDTTKQKTAEAVLRRSKEELEREVQERTEQLRHAQRMEAIGTLAGGIAHDFNNILAAILGFTTAAKNDVPADSPIATDLEEIIVAGSRGREIVRQMLTISRKQKAGPMKPHDLVTILKEAIDLIRVFSPSTIDIDIQVPGGPVPILCDETQLSQVILNIATNAVQAMKNTLNGHLIVGLEETYIENADNEILRVPMGPAARLYIADTGKGIRPDHLEQIFNPFFTTKSQGEGTGLGLSTSLVIVQGHRGDITVESELGKGTVFSIYLPIEDEAKQQLQEDQKSNSITGVYCGQELILLIDDEPQICRMGERVLKQLGYIVQTASDGMEALQLLLKTQIQFDLVITDLSMPRMTGLELARELRREDIEIPMILMSGYGEKAQPEEILAAGINAYLQKPTPKNELGKTIRAILDFGYVQSDIPLHPEAMFDEVQT